jgi:fibronectin-binding autotransporter adhesin
MSNAAILSLSPGSIFDVGSLSFSGTNFLYAANFLDLRVDNAIQISGSMYATATELIVPGTISGTGLLTVFSGSAELDGNNTYSGGTTLSAGLLAVGNGNALGTGALTISGGELLATATETIPNSVTMSGNFTIAAAHGQTLTFPGGVWTLNTSMGEVISFGAPGQDGTVVWGNPAGANINGSPVYSVAVQAGALRGAGPADLGLWALLGNAQQTTLSPGTTIDANGFGLNINDLTDLGGGHITDSGAAATLSVIGGNFSGVIDGGLNLIVNSSQLTLSGANAYTGTTTINPGATLILGNDGTAGSVPGAITDNGVLAINRSDNVVVNNVSGTGLLRQIGDGVTTLGTGLSYTGGTQISGGTLAVNDPSALGSGGVVTSGGELLAGATESIGNQLTMNGNFTIAAAHGQTLTIGTGGWFLSASGQTITFGAPGQDGTVLWSTSPGAIGNPGNGYTILVQAGTLRAADSNFGLLFNYDTRTAIRPAGTIDAAGFSFTVNDLEGGGHIIDSGGAATLTVNGGSFSGGIGGPLALVVTGNPLTLSGNNTYTGGTTINSGATLTLGNGGTTGSVPGAITDNGILAINRSDSFVVNNVSGTGQLQQIGPGVTGLGTGLSYSGGTLIGAGALVVNSAAALGSGGLTISGGELLAGATESIGNHLTMSGNFTIAAAHSQTLTFHPRPGGISLSAPARSLPLAPPARTGRFCGPPQAFRRSLPPSELLTRSWSRRARCARPTAASVSCCKTIRARRSRPPERSTLPGSASP